MAQLDNTRKHIQQQLVASYVNLKRLKLQHAALKSYHKCKAAKTLQQKKIEELHEQLKFWQNRSNIYEVCALLQKEEIATFQNGRYTEDIRQFYME